TLAEYQTLKAAVSNSSNALKAVGQGTGSGAGNNSSGFSALLAGYRHYDNGSFNSSIGYDAFFWSSTETGSTVDYMRLFYYDDNVYLSNTNKRYGFSVRCLKD
ncbi:MAG: hypothetical protein GY936_06995, partial [Ignavibacteriae bacterium]|nr:hypothetical protein [Ignavibacteriota bacterium]